jgi:hypothetical protein
MPGGQYRCGRLWSLYEVGDFTWAGETNRTGFVPGYPRFGNRRQGEAGGYGLLPAVVLRAEPGPPLRIRLFIGLTGNVRGDARASDAANASGICAGVSNVRAGFTVTFRISPSFYLC